MATFVITRLTFLEAIRRRIALAAFLLGLAFLVLFNLGFYFVRHETGLPTTPNSPTDQLLRTQVFNFLTLSGLYAINFLAVAMGALVSADTLAGEINSGTIQSIVTKPLRRSQIVLGKWLGFATLLGVYLLLMVGGLLLSVYVQSGYVMPNPVLGGLIIYLESLLIMSLTLACSSAFSTLATGALVFGLYGMAVVGGFVEQIGAALQNQTALNVGILSSLLMPSEALLRFALDKMSSAAMGLFGGPMLVVSRPSNAMVVYAVLYLLVCLTVATWHFKRRDL